jgi:cell division protein FtsN
MNIIKEFRVAVGLLLLLAGTAAPCWAKTVYSIQVAASEDKGSALETSEQMNRMGHHSFFRLETVPGKGQWYRIYVEKFGSKAQAHKEAAMLKTLGLLNEYYVRELKEVAEPKLSRAQTPPRQEKIVSSGIHFLHVGSFKEKENAEKSVVRLEGNGQKAFFAEEGAGVDKWFRTYIGEFAGIRDAQNAGSLLKEKGLISYFKVISFNKEGDPTAKNKNQGSQVQNSLFKVASQPRRP